MQPQLRCENIHIGFGQLPLVDVLHHYLFLNRQILQLFFFTDQSVPSDALYQCAHILLQTLVARVTLHMLDDFFYLLFGVYSLWQCP